MSNMILPGFANRSSPPRWVFMESDYLVTNPLLPFLTNHTSLSHSFEMNNSPNIPIPVFRVGSANSPNTKIHISDYRIMTGVHLPFSFGMETAFTVQAGEYWVVSGVLQCGSILICSSLTLIFASEEWKWLGLTKLKYDNAFEV